MKELSFPKEASPRKRRRHAIKFEAVGSRIEIIGGSIYPKEEGWQFLCPHCRKWLKGGLKWNQEACEFQFEIDAGLETQK